MTKPSHTNNKSLAVISDIHSNLEALQAVLADIEERGVKEIICLGDIVGYGPNPKECLDLVRKRCRVTLMGNHDHALLYEPTNFNLPAERACYSKRSPTGRCATPAGNSWASCPCGTRTATCCSFTLRRAGP